MKDSTFQLVRGAVENNFIGLVTGAQGCGKTFIVSEALRELSFRSALVDCRDQENPVEYLTTLLEKDYIPYTKLRDLLREQYSHNFELLIVLDHFESCHLSQEMVDAITGQYQGIGFVIVSHLTKTEINQRFDDKCGVKDVIGGVVEVNSALRGSLIHEAIEKTVSSLSKSAKSELEQQTISWIHLTLLREICAQGPPVESINDLDPLIVHIRQVCASSNNNDQKIAFTRLLSAVYRRGPVSFEELKELVGSETAKSKCFISALELLQSSDYLVKQTYASGSLAIDIKYRDVTGFEKQIADWISEQGDSIIQLRRWTRIFGNRKFQAREVSWFMKPFERESHLPGLGASIKIAKKNYQRSGITLTEAESKAQRLIRRSVASRIFVYFLAPVVALAIILFTYSSKQRTQFNHARTLANSYYNSPGTLASVVDSELAMNEVRKDFDRQTSAVTVRRLAARAVISNVDNEKRELGTRALAFLTSHIHDIPHSNVETAFAIAESLSEMPEEWKEQVVSLLLNSTLDGPFVALTKLNLDIPLMDDSKVDGLAIALCDFIAENDITTVTRFLENTQSKSIITAIRSGFERIQNSGNPQIRKLARRLFVATELDNKKRIDALCWATAHAEDKDEFESWLEMLPRGNQTNTCVRKVAENYKFSDRAVSASFALIRLGGESSEIAELLSEVVVAPVSSEDFLTKHFKPDSYIDPSPEASLDFIVRSADYVSADDVIGIIQASNENPAFSDVTRTSILGLGYYPSTNASAGLDTLEDIYRNNPDSGIHYACDWTMRQLGLRIPDTGSSERVPTGKNWRHVHAPDGKYEQQFVRINKCEFAFGSPANDACRIRDEAKWGLTDLKNDIEVSTTPITIAHFDAFFRERWKGDSYFDKLKSVNSNWLPSLPGAQSNSYPDEYIRRVGKAPQTAITWHMAAAFCNWMSEKHDLTPCFRKCEPAGLIPSDGSCTAAPATPRSKSSIQNVRYELKKDFENLSGFRLPTDKEWECLSRAGTANFHYFGDKMDDPSMGYFAWYAKNSISDTEHSLQEVAAKLPNPMGLFDTLGQCWEWTTDKYEGFQDDDIWRSQKGGSAFHSAKFVRCAALGSARQDNADRWGGFRIVRTLKPETE